MAIPPCSNRCSSPSRARTCVRVKPLLSCAPRPERRSTIGPGRHPSTPSSQAAKEAPSPVRVTFLGHAGLYVETRHGTVLCDPWFNPAYFCSWFVFPSNEDLDPSFFSSPDYLFVSHLHQDHLDRAFLQERVDKRAQVILPDYPTDHLRRTLQDLGFERFVPTRNNQPLELDGLRVMVSSLVTPTDGPIGDSALSLDDGECRLLDQNDSRPLELEPLLEFGPYDAHFLQFSGAIWYPMVYRFPQEQKRRLARAKRANQMARAVRYIRGIEARHVFPCAGPPCFLDDDLFWLNDLDRSEESIFLDQAVFLEHMADQGLGNGHLLVPGSVAELDGGRCVLTPPVPEDQVEAIFADKAGYLDAYRARARPVIEKERSSWPRGQLDVVAELKAWWEPLLGDAELTCAGVNGRVLLWAGDTPVVVDFLDRRVDRWRGEE